MINGEINFVGDPVIDGYKTSNKRWTGGRFDLIESSSCSRYVVEWNYHCCILDSNLDSVFVAEMCTWLGPES